MVSIGKIAYDAYFGHCGGKSPISGEQLPIWENQSEAIKAAWEAVAEAVIEIVE